MNKTIVRRDIPADLSHLAHLHPILRRLYGAREINSASELVRELKGLPTFSSLRGIDIATERLWQALNQQQHILIVGDFDADGATSTAVAVQALRACGATRVSYIVPNRFAYGYGLTPEIVEAAQQRHPDLLITVDSGITSHAGVRRANEYGIDVIVTDHHLPATTLPPACAIVNPNQYNDAFPSKCLAGVGVIFYVMLALRARLSKEQWFVRHGIECPNMAQFLDLVALGTIADVVPLDKNNRILVHQGLQRIRAGIACPGICALLQVAGKQANDIRAADLAFAVAPRLNAAGRLDDMTVGVNCLLASQPAEALHLAQQLDDLNKERRVIETQMQCSALHALEKLKLARQLPCGICLYRDDWHQGVVGLVAGRIKEKFHRPTIAFAKVNDKTLKGSARSIPGLHIRDVLADLTREEPTLITKFGGHALAAGLSLPITHFTKFSQMFAQAVGKRLAAHDLQPVLLSDGELTTGELTLAIAELLHDAGPWGQGFPAPLFDGRFKLMEQRLVGAHHLKMTLQPMGGGCYLTGIAFNVNTDRWPDRQCDYVHLAYELDINKYNGRRELQLIVQEIVPTNI